MPEEKLEIRPLIYSRIVGYLMPLENWNDGKKQEFKERVLYKVEPGKDLTQNEPPASH